MGIYSWCISKKEKANEWLLGLADEHPFIASRVTYFMHLYFGGQPYDAYLAPYDTNSNDRKKKAVSVLDSIITLNLNKP